MVSLIELRAFVREKPGRTLRDLAWHFRVSEGMMEALLSKLIDRGDIEKLERPACCCGSCECASHEGPATVYRVRRVIRS